MSDINVCSARKLSSKAGIGLELANKIVDYRHQEEKIACFKELWSVDGMTKPIMCVLKSNFFIDGNTHPSLSNHGRNACKSRTKFKPIRKSGKSSRLGYPTASLRNCNIKIIPPLSLNSSPSGRKLTAVYQITPSVNLPPPCTANKGVLAIPAETPPHRGSNDNALPSHRTASLSPQKELSIQQWLNDIPGLYTTKNVPASCPGHNLSDNAPLTTDNEQIHKHHSDTNWEHSLAKEILRSPNRSENAYAADQSSLTDVIEQHSDISITGRMFKSPIEVRKSKSYTRERRSKSQNRELQCKPSSARQAPKSLLRRSSSKSPIAARRSRSKESARSIKSSRGSMYMQSPPSKSSPKVRISQRIKNAVNRTRSKCQEKRKTAGTSTIRAFSAHAKRRHADKVPLFVKEDDYTAMPCTSRQKSGHDNSIVCEEVSVFSNGRSRGDNSRSPSADSITSNRKHGYTNYKYARVEAGTSEIRAQRHSREKSRSPLHSYIKKKIHRPREAKTDVHQHRRDRRDVPKHYRSTRQRRDTWGLYTPTIDDGRNPFTWPIFKGKNWCNVL